MHILFLNSARHWGGNEKWSLMAAAALAGENRVTVAWRAPEIGERIPGAVGSMCLPFVSEADMVTLWRLYRFVKREKVHVIVSTKRKDYVTGALLHLLTGAAHFVRLGIVRPIGNNAVNRFIFKKHCAGFIVNAPQIKEVLLHGGFLEPERVHVIFNGLDFKELEQAAKTPVEKPFPVMLAASGLLIARKGFDILLAGFKAWMDEGGEKSAGLWILGDGPEADRLREQVREYGLERRVVFCGYQTNPYAYYAAADIFVLLSGNEGISNALLEAMYLKCAVITTAAGGADQVITNGEEGLLITRAQRSLHQALKELYDRPALRDKLGQRARRKVEDMFSMTRMRNELTRIFREVSGGG